jgi:hypothetical protein
MVDLHKEIWANSNTFIHGKTREEQLAKAREAIIKQVRNIYNKPPTLAKQYPAVTSINIEQRLQRSTSQLKDWMAHLKHQIKMTELILAQRRPPGQMTIQEAFKNATAWRDAVHKYPP